MADRHDRKLLVPPLSELKLASPAAASDDPVAELAGIASDRTTFDPSPAPTAKTVPVNGAVASDVALANDLESELLKDLQALVSSRLYEAPPPAPALAPPAAPAAPVPKPTAGAPPPPEARPAAPTAAALAAPLPTPATPSVVPLPAIEPERQAETAVPPSSENAVSSVPPSQSEHQAPPAASSADGPPVIGLASDTLEMAEKIDLAALLRPIIAAHSANAADPPAVEPTGRWAHPAERRPAEPRAAARDPGRFAPVPRGAALFRRNAVKPKDDELPKLAASNGSASVEEEAVPPEDRDALARYIEYGEPPSRPHEIEEFSHRKPRRSLFIGGALLAVVLAAGVTYVMTQNEKSVTMPPTVAADPAKIGPAATSADTDDKVAAAPAPSGDDNNPISRVIEPAGPGFDPAAKAADAPASADHPATDVATGGDDKGHTSPKKAGTLVVGPPMPVVVSNKAASDGSAGKPHPGASPAVPPSANDGGAADAGSDAPSGETQMDAIINNKGLSIPINVDPLATSGGANKAAADAAVPTPLPEPVGVSASDASGAAPASDNGTAVADDVSAVAAAPARVPLPRLKPTVTPDKAGEPLPTPPPVEPTPHPVASSGDLY